MCIYVGCSKSVARYEMCKLQFDYSEQCLIDFELCVVQAERCGLENGFIDYIKHIVAMPLWSDSGENDPRCSPTSFTHHAGITLRH